MSDPCDRAPRPWLCKLLREIGVPPEAPNIPQDKMLLDRIWEQVQHLSEAEQPLMVAELLQQAGKHEAALMVSEAVQHHTIGQQAAPITVRALQIKANALAALGRADEAEAATVEATRLAALYTPLRSVQ